MFQQQRVNRTYTRYASDRRIVEELLREILQRIEIESLRDLSLRIEMNTKFKKLKEKTDYSQLEI